MKRLAFWFSFGVCAVTGVAGSNITGQVAVATFADATNKAWEDGKLTLARDGRALYALAQDADATSTAVFAVRELKRHLDEATGADFPVLTNTAPAADMKTIEVGTSRARQIVGVARADALGREACVVTSKDGMIAICGGGDAGVLYGVYAFLERQLGVRWFTAAGVTKVPRQGTLAFPAPDFTEEPSYPYRWTLLADRLLGPCSDTGRIFLLRNRLNVTENNWGWMPPKTDAPSGELPYAMKVVNPTVHSLFYYLPPKKLFVEHPDWYSMMEDGKRVARQVCFSNSELRKALTERLLRHVKDNGGEGYFDLSARDEPGPLCLCPGCKALAEKYASVGGPLFDYLLELSPKVKAAYPKANIHFLVYRKEQTQKPPKGIERFPDNLIAVFAPIDDDFTKPYSHPHNAKTFENLKRWCRIARVWAWYYPQNFDGVPPHLALSRLAEDTRLAREAGQEGCCYEHDNATDVGVGMTDPISWILTRLYRDPAADPWALAKEYCEGCYGSAAADMLAYMRELDAASVACPDFVRWDERNVKILTPENLVRWTKAFDAMERKAADDAGAVHRIRQARVSVDLEVLAKWKQIASAGLLSGRSADEFRDRLSETVERSLDERLPRPPNKWYADQCADIRKGWIERIEDAHLRAVSVRKPLPPEFERIPEGERLEFYPDKTVPMEKMDDAAYGFAMHEKRSEENHRTKDFGFGVFDYGPVTRPLIARTVRKDEIVPDVFRLYKVGRTKIPTDKCRYWNTYSWRMRASLTAAFKPGVDTEWDVYASLKFEGPAYSPKSQKEK